MAKKKRQSESHKENVFIRVKQKMENHMEMDNVSLTLVSIFRGYLFRGRRRSMEGIFIRIWIIIKGR